jgi:allophanate hydrolase subunit 1
MFLESYVFGTATIATGFSGTAQVFQDSLRGQGVLILAAGTADLDLLRPHIGELLAGTGAGTAGGGSEDSDAGETLVIPVRYDGADLAAVGAETGLGADGVVAAHCGATYRGCFSGFAPGFCYLEGLSEALRVPRLAEPRPVVPAGSVAVADRYSALYPRATPGGWRLLGRTDARLWDSRRDPPALVRPGTIVRFSALG